MLKTARRGMNLLGKSAGLVETFFRDQFNPDGGFRDRQGRSDLYYSVFGSMAMEAVTGDYDKDKFCRYLGGFSDIDSLDLVTTASLVRCWANVDFAGANSLPRRLQEHLNSFRKADGGYNTDPLAGYGTVYGVFLALGAYQDLNAAIPPQIVQGMNQCLLARKLRAGSYSNEPGIAVGSVPVTAAAAVARHYLWEPVEAECGQWLLSNLHRTGGFLAIPSAPMPDLLSTATALFALEVMSVDISAIRRQCLDYLESLWTGKGWFRGHWGDNTPDCEYTFYGLLALGILRANE